MTEAVIIRDMARYSDTDEISIRWSAIIDGETVSELWLDPATGEITQIETPTAHRRQGYATALYRAAAASGEPIYHAAASHRTAHGDLFANAVGGDALECRYGCCTTEEDE